MSPIQTQFPAGFLARTSGIIYDYYVDSVNGNDVNDGSTPTKAFRTIGALPALQASDSIGLARGSYWREQLTLDAVGVKAYAYGMGDAPVLDGSNIVASGDWTKTGGQTNVYQANVTLAAQLAQQWVNAFEDGVFLTRASSIATCDSTPGSYYPTANYGSITLYIHPKDNTNPTNDGKVYEVTARNYGALLAANGCEIHGVETRNNMSASGSLVASAASCRFYDCLALNGSKHSVFMADGGYAENVTASNCYFGSNTSTLFIYNNNTPTGLGLTYKNCVATMPAYNSLVSAYYGHKNISGDFGALVFDGCAANNCAVGFSAIDVTSVTLIDCTSSGCSNAINPTSAITWTLSGGSFSAANRAILFGAAGITLSATNVALTSTSLYTISGNQNNLTISFMNCTLDHALFGFAVLITAGTGMNISVNGTTFARSLYLSLPAGVTYTGDNNVFVGGASGNQFTINGVNYSLASWKALVAPHDANSITT